MDEIVSAETQEPLFQTRLLGVFSMLALLLAAVGIYGVLAYAVTERRHEFGIRMALGAQARDVMSGVMRGTLGLTLPGIVIGAAGAVVVTRVLDRFLFTVTARDPLTFVTVAILLAATAAVAGWLPARRAAHVDPATALRSE
jgi:putative ABC transport system permease protein